MILQPRPTLETSSLPKNRERQKGVAMVMAVTALAMMTMIAMEIMYDSTVEYTVNAQALNRLKAYYAARSALDLSLLRIKIYQSAQQKMSTAGAAAGPFQKHIDQIWRFPLAWPLPLPDDMNSVDKENANKATKASLIDTSFTATIEDEGSKIDLNDLVSPAKKLAEITKQRLLESLQKHAQDDPLWQDLYSSYRFEELVNNIADWMTDKRDSLNGGDKRAGYEDLNRDKPFYPTNGMFRTLQELRLVKGMNDDFYDFLAPRLTIYGMKGINPNVATAEVLKSLDPGITDEVVKEIIARRDGDGADQGPFNDASDFWGFVQSKARLTNASPEQIPLTFDSLVSFRIRAVGTFGSSAIREITAIVTDLDLSTKRLNELVAKEKKPDESGGAGGGGSGAGGPGTNPANQDQGQGGNNFSSSKGPPRIVFWSEK